MHFNSFHSNRMDDIPDFLKRLQNKITYYIYKTVNDDDANEDKESVAQKIQKIYKERIEFFDKSYQESSLKNDPNSVLTSI